jgi:hypothetical protein
VAVSFLGALGSASAEVLRANIPFGFSADGTSMPAGTYAIRTVASTPYVLVFENEQTKVQTFVFVRALAGASIKPVGLLTFADAGHERMDLANIATYGQTYELNVQSTRSALKGVALTLASTGK